jgi:hypothetical protein
MKHDGPQIQPSRNVSNPSFNLQHEEWEVLRKVTYHTQAPNLVTRG